jgi:hypothetical protein
MKRVLSLTLGLCLLATCMSAQILNNANTNQSSFYGNWMANSTNAVATGAGTMSLNQCYFRTNPNGINQAGSPFAGTGMNSTFFPLVVGESVTIVDGASTETLAITAVGAPAQAPVSSVTPFTCSFTVSSFGYAHAAGVTVISGDSGLWEAAADNGKGYGITSPAIVYSGMCTTASTTNSAVYLLGTGDLATAACSVTSIGQLIVAPRAGVMRNLSVSAGTAGYASTSGVFVVTKNGPGGSSTALTCTVGTATSCQDVTHLVHFNAGDYFTISFTGASTSSETLANVVATVELF